MEKVKVTANNISSEHLRWTVAHHTAGASFLSRFDKTNPGPQRPSTPELLWFVRILLVAIWNDFCDTSFIDTAKACYSDSCGVGLRENWKSDA